MSAEAHYFGGDSPTNNTAELRALEEAVLKVVGLCVRSGRGVRFVGDSKLVVDFCLREARPKRVQLLKRSMRLDRPCLHPVARQTSAYPG